MTATHDGLGKLTRIDSDHADEEMIACEHGEINTETISYRVAISPTQTVWVQIFAASLGGRETGVAAVAKEFEDFWKAKGPAE